MVLRSLGYVAAENIVIEFQWAEENCCTFPRVGWLRLFVAKSMSSSSSGRPAPKKPSTRHDDFRHRRNDGRCLSVNIPSQPCVPRSGPSLD